MWVLLAIYDGEKYAQEIILYITSATDGNLEVREQSLYRTLRRFSSLGLVKLTKKPSSAGPDRKYYSMTERGAAVLSEFTRRNIAPLLQPTINALFTRLQ